MVKNRRIIVTGAARGLGFAFAQRIAEAGARVALADILVERGQAAVKELTGGGYQAYFVRLDLSDPASISSCIDNSVECLGGLDGLVNNGAIATGIGGKTMDVIDIEAWDRVMNVNVKGLWLTTRSALPHLEQSDSASVVNIASDTALWGAPRLMHYVASKGAVMAMTRAMARELGEKHIRVNAVAPGLTKGEATGYVPEERHQLYMDGRALKREQVAGDVTGAVLFLLSEDARFITGQVLPVNGGFVMN